MHKYELEDEQERMRELAKIERDVAALNEIQQNIFESIKDQDLVLREISNNIDKSAAHVTEARIDVETAQSNQNNYFGLVTKILATGALVVGVAFLKLRR